MSSTETVNVKVNEPQCEDPQSMYKRLTLEEHEEMLDFLAYHKACGVVPSSKPIFQMED